MSMMFESWERYRWTRNDDHGGGDDVVLVQVAGDVKIAILGVVVGVAEEGRLRGGVKALREWEVVVPVPASERRHVTPPVVVLLFKIQPQTQTQKHSSATETYINDEEKAIWGHLLPLWWMNVRLCHPFVLLLL